MTAPGPPRWAELLAGALVADPGVREAVLGDLAEEHALRAEAGSARAADRWYRREVARSAARLAVCSIGGAGARGYLLTAAAVGAGYAAIAVLVGATEALLDVTLGGSGWVRAVASLAAGVLCGVAGGYAAAAIGRRAPLLSSVALGVACAAISLALLRRPGDGTPLWYRIGVVVVFLPATAAGGLLRIRRTRKREVPPTGREG